MADPTKIFVIIAYIQYLTSSLKEAEQEIQEKTFEFEKEELTLKILDSATPGWIIDPLITPCTVSHINSSVVNIILHHAYYVQITRREVDSRMQPQNIEHGPIVCKVKIAVEKPSKPPDEVLRNRIQVDGVKPGPFCFNIHFNPPLPQTDSDGKCCIANIILTILATTVLCYSF